MCVYTLCIRYILDLWSHKIQFEKIFTGCEGTVINNTLGLLCRRPAFTSEIYGHLKRDSTYRLRTNPSILVVIRITLR